MKNNKAIILLAFIIFFSTVLVGCGDTKAPNVSESIAEEQQTLSESEPSGAVPKEDENIPEDTSVSEETSEEIPEETLPEPQAKTVMLNSGYEMPIIGLGTFTLDNEVTERSVYHALLSGYRLIDTAKYYDNEIGVGNAVRRAIEDGIITREEVFITTKILPHSYSDYSAAIDDSLDKLGLEYIDLMLIHQRGSREKELYQAIEKAIEEGIIRSLGISNYYTIEEYDYITQGTTIVPAVIQNENHPYYQNTALQEYVSQYGVYMESYYPLGGRGHTQDLFNDETIVAIAKVHEKTSPQILIKWHIQAGYIVIPGSSNPDHIEENIDIFDFELSEDEMARIAALNTNQRYETW